MRMAVRDSETSAGHPRPPDDAVPTAPSGGGSGRKPPTPPKAPSAPGDGPEDEPTAAAHADFLFEAHRSEPLSPLKREAILAKQADVEWLGRSGPSPISIAFGAQDPYLSAAGAEASERLAPSQAEAIVERQLKAFGVALLRVQTGVDATRRLVQLTEGHEGRTAVHSYNVLNSETPKAFEAGRFYIAAEGGRTDLSVYPLTSGIGSPQEYLLHEVSENEVHLVRRDATGKYQVRNQNGLLVVDREDAFSVFPADTEYLHELSEELAAYQNLLFSVAKSAGFMKRELVDKSNTIDLGRLFTEVSPAIARPGFQASLPYDLVTSLQVQAETIAHKVNPEDMEGGLTALAKRVGGYFNAVLENR
jgi:hypothetical protein